MTHRYALILAGGSGTRFWPLSRNAKPKQLLNLFGNGTLIQQTVQRLDGLIPKENIFILTNDLQVGGVQDLLPEIPTENIIAEPAKRDTAPAVALGVGLIANRDQNASMVVLPSDQLITDVPAFQKVISDAFRAAEDGKALVTVGIKPTWACPSYGYVERGAAVDLGGEPFQNVPHEVIRFREKPAPKIAEEYLKQGSFAWNAGMFIWTVSTVTAELQQHTPELADFIAELRDQNDPLSTLSDTFPKLTPISIDYALMEKASKVFNIEANFDWDDVGSWISIAKYLDEEGTQNRTNTALTEVESQNNIVFNDRPESRVALLGVKDLIVVQTDDALLVANRHQADDIKKVVSDLPENLL